jgi:hypothetical protein
MTINIGNNKKAILYKFASQTHAKIVDADGFTLEDTIYYRDIVNSLNQYQDVLKFIYQYQLKNEGK